jgi:septal ring factor EnvC (AmiA/AmiB activator)
MFLVLTHSPFFVCSKLLRISEKRAKELEDKLKANAKALVEAKSQIATTEIKRAKELEAKLKAVEKSLEEAKARASDAEDKIKKEGSRHSHPRRGYLTASGL